MWGNFFSTNRIILFNLCIIIMLSIPILFLRPYLGSIFVSEHRPMIHALFEMFTIFMSYSIFVYGWYSYPYILSRIYLWLPVIFFSTGTLDLLHMITYEGMPTFITEGSMVKSGWFTTFARIIESTGIFLLLLLIHKDIKKKLMKRNWIVLGTLFCMLMVASIIFIYENHLPLLYVNGQGTLIRTILHSIICGILIISIIYIIKNLTKEKDNSSIYLLIGVSFFLVNRLLPFIIDSLDGYYNFLGHLSKVLGSAYIFIGFYSSKLQLTYLKKEEIEEDLNATQSLLESFFENTEEGMLILEKQGKVIRANKGFVNIIGLEESRIIGKCFKTIIKEANDTNEMIEQALNGLNITNLETSHQREDGETVYLLITLSNIPSTKDKMNIAVVIKDITERKIYEQRLQEAKQELFDTIRQQQGIIFKYHKVDNSFIHTFFEGDLVYQLGLSSEQFISHRFKSPPEHVEINSPYYYYQIAWGGLDVKFELKWKQSTLAVSLKPIIKHKKVVEVLGSIIDITQLKKTEESLRKSEKLAVVGELAAGVAHEIRNPLTTLKGFTQLLKEEVDPKRLSLFNFMTSELDRIEMITNEFMTIAKPQAIEYKLTNIMEIINQVLVILEPQAILQNVDINRIYTDTYPKVLSDGNQLKQVFINIIKNAFEAMPNGGNLTVEIKQVTNHYITISIKDTGVGIPEEVIPKLFEPFYTLKEKGIGLGLMVSYRIIESHNGNIEFSSELFKGTVVTVKLPIHSTVLDKTNRVEKV